MIALARTLTASGVITALFTLSCLAGAWSAIPHRSSTFTAPADCPFACSIDGHTVHRVECPLCPEQASDRANLIYFHDLDEIGSRDTCNKCIK